MESPYLHMGSGSFGNLFKWNMNTPLHSKHSPSSAIEVRSPHHPTCSAFPPPYFSIFSRSLEPVTINYRCVNTLLSFSKLHRYFLHTSSLKISSFQPLTTSCQYEGAWTWLSSHILEDTLHLDGCPTPISSSYLDVSAAIHGGGGDS